MWDWLLSPVDATRVHEVGFAISWHARAMVVAWGAIAPLAVLAARFFKIMPGQDWPRDLDNQTWWISHWLGQLVVVALSGAGLVLVLPGDVSDMSLHNALGYAVLVGLMAQVLLGLLRGTKGGPTAPAADGSLHGDHYDMTRWRRDLNGFTSLLATRCFFWRPAQSCLGFGRPTRRIGCGWCWYCGGRL